MNNSFRKIAFIALGILGVRSSLWAQPAPIIVQTDICIYGGTSGGVIAAVQAELMGKKAVLIEPSRHLGGMSSGGLGNADMGNPRAVGGLAMEFFRRIGTKYDKPMETQIEPHVAEKVFNEMARGANVDVRLGSPIQSVTKKNGVITGLTTVDGTLYRARMYIDATYEGDLMAKAGVSSTLTREANAQYGETVNGVQFQERFMPVVKWGTPGTNGRRSDGCGVWDRDIPIDPYVVKGDPHSGVLPLIDPDPVGPIGSKASGVQAYCYRLTMTDDPDNRIPLGKPDYYDPKEFEIVGRFIEACLAAGDDMDMRWFVQDYRLPNHKWDFNTATWGSDLPGTGTAWCEGNFEQRAMIAKKHKDYQQGLFWFLLTDSRVPKKVRDQLGQYGYCKDEFVDNDGWPYTLYVREGRRMVSAFVLTEDYVQSKKITSQSVGLGSYGLDTHLVRRVIRDGMVVREDKRTGGVPHPYPIDYGTIVPKAEECTNLYVTFAISASHVAFASTRMEPILMILSQSAATAACLAIDAGVPVQQVNYDALRRRLLADHQILDWNPEPK